MKILKSLAMGALTLSIAGMANADTTFHITGSTAFRAATVTAIEALLTSYGSSAAPSTSDAASGSDTSANQICWTGSNSTLGNYTILGAWSGSGAGVQTVAGNVATIGFIPSGHYHDGYSISQVYTTPGNGGSFVVPDAAMSDVYQSTTGFLGHVPTYLSGSTTTTNVNYQDLSAGDNIVAIVTFKWMASTGFPRGGAGTVTDNTGTFNVSKYSMTPQLAENLLGAGVVPIAQITGSNSDETNWAIATGRNADSGTRMTTLAETGYGVVNEVNQYKPNPTTAGATLTSLALYPLNTVNGISTGAAGNDGETSGKTVRNYLGDSIPSSVVKTIPLVSLSGQSSPSGYFLTYLGTADSASVTSTAIELPYNGTYYSDTATEEGQYTFWGYEHLFTLPGLSTSNPNGNTFAGNLVTQIQAVTEGNLANAGLQLGTMNVQRTSDGGTVSASTY